MKLVSPDARTGTSGRGRTMTERIKALAPTLPDLVDAGFLLAASVLAIYGFATTFDTPLYLFVGAFGVLLAMAAAHLAAVLRWHWLVTVLLVVVEFLLLGGVVSMREGLIAGFVPTPEVVLELGSMLIGGWKEMITTLPPLAGDGPFLALPYFMGLVAGAVGFSVARRSRRPLPGVLTPLVLLVAVILLGTLRPAGVLLQGLGFAVLMFTWLAVRSRRRRRLTGTGHSSRTTVLTGTAMVVAAAVTAGLLGGWMPGQDTTRFVLRTYVQPPIEIKELPSPLVSFRKFSSEGPRSMRETSLLQVDGVPEGSLLRFAVLDDYSGRAWSATGGNGGSEAGFQRLGREIPGESLGSPVSATIKVLAGYEQARELSPWVPSLGSASSIVFGGANVRVHTANLRYNLSTSQAVLADNDRLHDGDTLTVTSVPLALKLGNNASPGGQSPVDPSAYTFLAPTAQKWAGGLVDPATRVAGLAKHLRQEGAWSDGSRAGEGQYLPGHGQGRLANFVLAQQLVGSDEQYAATFALLCNQAGFPARVVFGAVVPRGGEVKGQHVTAWVEVLSDSGWRGIPPAEFIPSRSKHPTQEPQVVAQDLPATYVPPPNPARLPGAFDQLTEGKLTGTDLPNGWLDALARWGLLLLTYAGPPIGLVLTVLGGIAAAKAIRRRGRRTRGGPDRRVAAGWDEVIDQATDMGRLVPRTATRLEQSKSIGANLVGDLAVLANTATFGVDAPLDADAAEYWTIVAARRKELLRGLNRRGRFVARFNPRSLLPERLASVPLPRVSFTRPKVFTRPTRAQVGEG